MSDIERIASTFSEWLDKTPPERLTQMAKDWKLLLSELQRLREENAKLREAVEDLLLNFAIYDLGESVTSRLHYALNGKRAVSSENSPSQK